ncbi:MAG: hypothetical protein Q9166_001300 [cf. Caloplaca sp. 2 TL-2023]
MDGDNIQPPNSDQELGTQSIEGEIDQANGVARDANSRDIEESDNHHEDGNEQSGGSSDHSSDESIGNNNESEANDDNINSDRDPGENQLVLVNGSGYDVEPVRLGHYYLVWVFAYGLASTPTEVRSLINHQAVLATQVSAVRVLLRWSRNLQNQGYFIVDGTPDRHGNPRCSLLSPNKDIFQLKVTKAIKIPPSTKPPSGKASGKRKACHWKQHRTDTTRQVH